MKTYLDLEAALATPFVHPGGAAATAHLLSSLKLGPGARALDLGCGTGATSQAGANTGAAVVAFERMPAMIAATRHRCPRVKLVRGDDDADLPFANGSFDAAWARLESWIFIGHRAP